MSTANLNELNINELRSLVNKLQEQLSQKDRQISHLTKNAKKWVQKFDEHQNNVAENVIKKFELEFESERNELHAKLAKLSHLNSRLVARLKKSELLMERLSQANDVLPMGRTDNPEMAKDEMEEGEMEEIEVDMLAEPTTITEIEFSNEMKEILSKYAT